MARSKRYVNFGVSLTPAGGSLAVYNEIMGIKIMRGAKQLAAYGDAKFFPTLLINVERHRSITLVGGDVSKMMQLNPDTLFTVVIVLNDAKNPGGSGTLTVTLVDALIETDEHGAQNNDWGMSTVTFNAFSVDGIVDPLTVAETP
jgi:hypothetical protein